MDLEPVPFNKGFYSIDMTFSSSMSAWMYIPCQLAAQLLSGGISVFNKKVILFGSEGKVKMFSSDLNCDDVDTQLTSGRVLPKATVQLQNRSAFLRVFVIVRWDVAIPVAGFRTASASVLAASLETNTCRNVYVTIGVFTIVQIVRNVQMLIPCL